MKKSVLALLHFAADQPQR